MRSFNVCRSAVNGPHERFNLNRVQSGNMCTLMSFHPSGAPRRTSKVQALVYTRDTASLIDECGSIKNVLGLTRRPRKSSRGFEETADPVLDWSRSYIGPGTILDLVLMISEECLRNLVLVGSSLGGGPAGWIIFPVGTSAPLLSGGCGPPLASLA